MRCNTQPKMPPDHSSSNSSTIIMLSETLIVMSKAAGQAGQGKVCNSCSKRTATCLFLFLFCLLFPCPVCFFSLFVSLFLCLEQFIVPPLTHQTERPQDTEMQLQLTAERLLGLASSKLYQQCCARREHLTCCCCVLAQHVQLQLSQLQQDLRHTSNVLWHAVTQARLM